MKTIFRAILATVVTVSPPLGGQGRAPEKGSKQEEPRKQEPSGQRQEPEPQEKPKPKPEKPQQEPATPAKPKPEKPQQEPATPAKPKPEKPQQEPSAPPKQQKPGEKQTQSQREKQHGQHGQRIPPEKFQSNFGSQHHFRVQHLQDARRFQQGGYWFEIVEVWPVGWAYEDDCYIEQDGDDYYLVDVFHPGIRLQVIVVEA